MSDAGGAVPDSIRLSSPATRELAAGEPAPRESWEVPVLFEDEHLLAVDKPSGLLSSPDRYDPDRPNLMRLLHDGIAQQKPWAARRNLNYLANAHRLDFETSGVMLLAKTKPVLVALAEQFATAKPSKLYLALVSGSPPEDLFTIDLPLAPDPRRPGTMGVAPKRGKQSRTDIEVVQRFRGYTFLHCRPVTGRTHQIRVHLQRSGLPILADSLYYGQPLLLSDIKRAYRPKPGEEERPLIPRLALHAHQLTLRHPVTDTDITITSPMPKHFAVALKYLRQFAGL
jgi:RluA family pseudouridine synthase